MSRKMQFLASIACAAAFAAQAQQAAPPASLGLAPAQIEAVRAISRHVLAAKKSTLEDPSGADQLAQLRASVDQLIAVELDPDNRPPITVLGEELPAQTTARAAIQSRRASARADARALAAKLRASVSVSPQAMVIPASAGLPVAEQRARLFERWSQQLDSAVADSTTDRLPRLLALRRQLRPTKGTLADAPLAHGTPTLQAMPAGYVAPNKESKP